MSTWTALYSIASIVRIDCGVVRLSCLSSYMLTEVTAISTTSLLHWQYKPTADRVKPTYLDITQHQSRKSTSNRYIAHPLNLILEWLRVLCYKCFRLLYINMWIILQLYVCSLVLVFPRSTSAAGGESIIDIHYIDVLRFFSFFLNKFAYWWGCGRGISLEAHQAMN